MTIMKRAAFVSVLLLMAVNAFATTSSSSSSARHFANPLLDDVVQMSRAGLSDNTIIAYVKSRRSRLDAEVTANDLIALQHAGVNENVIGYIATTVGIQEPPAAPNSSPPNSVNYSAGEGDDEGAYPAVPQSNGDVTYSSGDGSPYGYGYSPYWYAWAPYYSWGWWGYPYYPYYRWGWWGWGHGWHGGHGGHVHGFSHGTVHGGGGHGGGGHMGGHGGGHGGHH